MKKIYILGFLVIILVIGSIFIFSTRPKEDDELTINRNIVIDSIGKTSDTRIVVKRLDTKDFASYFVITLTQSGFEEFNYRFYNNKEEYDEWVLKYEDPLYQLEKNEKALVTKIFAQRGNKVVNESIYDSIMKKYSDKDKYEIIK